MHLANPIYDSAFKYLMEDLEIAGGLIGKIINAEILTIELKPREITAEVKAYGGVAIFRLDFKANIKTVAGEQKTVLIELQKSKKPEDIMRFRRYLGETYRKPESVQITDNKTEEIAYPIITIYFLGYPLQLVQTPVLMVNRVYHDLINQTVLEVKDPFVEMLTHDSYIIQIRRLSKPYRTELEQILKLFDQQFQLTDTPQLLRIPDAEILGDQLRERMANRLRKAATDEEVLHQLEVEEEVEMAFENFVREIQDLKEERETLKEETESLKEETESLKEETESLKEETESLKEETESLKEKATDLEGENEDLRKQLEELRKKLGR